MYKYHKMHRCLVNKAVWIHSLIKNVLNLVPVVVITFIAIAKLGTSLHSFKMATRCHYAFRFVHKDNTSQHSFAHWSSDPTERSRGLSNLANPAKTTPRGDDTWRETMFHVIIIYINLHNWLISLKWWLKDDSSVGGSKDRYCLSG